MNEVFLTLKQNLCAARIFLNVFGLTLEEVDDINEFSKIRIFDKNSNIVGELYFDNGKIIMNANYSDSVLNASYDISKISGFKDIECNALFCEWASNIEYEFKNDNFSLTGEFLVKASADSQFGIKCSCHPLILWKISDKETSTLKIQRDGRVFGMEEVWEDGYAKIDIMPFDDLNGYIIHDDKKNSDTKYPYRRYACIRRAAERGEERNKLKVFLVEEKCQYNSLEDKLLHKEPYKISNYKQKLVDKIEKDETRDAVIQKGLLMQEIDPEMFDVIKLIRDYLTIGDISLIDNLVSVCYDSYSDEEIKAILGLDRIKMDYQNGTDNLKDAYFGKNKEKDFINQSQVKILKKN